MRPEEESQPEGGPPVHEEPLPRQQQEMHGQGQQQQVEGRQRD
jgi:hypothetical protein